MVKTLKQYDFYDCIEKGLLRNMPSSKENAEKSIKTALQWIGEGEKNLKINTLNSAIIAFYLAMFHSARAILFFDGYREKSHYCIARYLEEKYAKKKLLENRWIELLDYYREIRHNDQYNVNSFITKEEAENAFKSAKEFVERMDKLLNNLKNRH